VESNLVQYKKLEESRILQERILGLVRTGKFGTIEQLVETLRSIDSHSPSIEEIREAVMALKQDEKIRLEEPSFQGSFLRYISSRYYSALPLWLSLLAITCSLVTSFFLPNVESLSTMRFVAGAAIVFIIPGYAVLGLIFPQKEISLIERVGLSIMTSFAIVAILWITLEQLNLGAEINTVVSSMTVAGALLMTASSYQRYLIKSTRKRVVNT